MPSSSDEKSSVWNSRREWLAFIIGALTFVLAVGGYLINRNSVASNRVLVLIADKANDPAGELGLSFVFHPLNAGQKISSLAITFPPAISTAHQTAVPLTQELDLSVAAIPIEHYRSTHYPPSQPASTTIWDGNIPVVLEAQYVFGDESLTHRGLYKVRTRILWKQSGPPWVAKFQDIVFDHSIEEGTDYGQVLTQALIAEEQAQRKLFDPPR